LDETFEIFKNFKSEVKNKNILKGGKYFLLEFFTLCEQHRIVYKISALYTQYNGLAERKQHDICRHG